jgi:hypothetical protein
MTDGPAAWQTPPELPGEQPGAAPNMQQLLELTMLTQYDGSYTIPLPVSIVCIARESMLLRQVTPDSPPELITEIGAVFTEWEERFPGAPLWDSMRTNMATRLYGETHLEAATEMIHGMRYPHNQAGALLDVTAKHPDAYEALFSGVIRQYQKDPDATRRTRFVQAVLDQAIDSSPEHPSIEQYEEMLRSQNPAYDPVQGWIDSQREAVPDMPWDNMSAGLNDPRWANTPMRWRMQMVKKTYFTSRRLGTDVSTEQVLGVITTLDQYAERFPDASMWDAYKADFSRQLMEAGNPAFAFDFARSIQDLAYQYGVAESFMIKGYREESGELRAIIDERIRRGDTGKWEVPATE